MLVGRNVQIIYLEEDWDSIIVAGDKGDEDARAFMYAFLRWAERAERDTPYCLMCECEIVPGKLGGLVVSRPVEKDIAGLTNVGEVLDEGGEEFWTMSALCGECKDGNSRKVVRRKFMEKFVENIHDESASRH